MRRSLSARLLALSLTVAVAAVAATAWLASRTTADRLAGEFSRSLEADAFVYTQLLAYAASNPDWSDVGGLVAELAARTGRRVALTTTSGQRLADSAAAGGGPGLAVPAVAAAVVDAFAPLDEVARVFPVDSGPVPTGTAPWSAVRLFPPGIVDARDQQLDEVAACLDAVRIGGSPDGGEALGGAPAEAEALARCGAYEILVPSEDDLARARDITDRAKSCLRGRVDDPDQYAEWVDLVSRPSGFATTVFDRPLAALPTGDVPGTPPGETVDAPVSGDSRDLVAVEECVADAQRAVLGPLVADPALLYLGPPPDGGVLAAAGGGDLVAAVALVLLVAVGVTVLAGRRLVAPIAELTGAARRIEGGDRATRVRVRGRDDVARLGAAFNAMAASVEESEQRRRAMVSDVAHELRTPLTTLRGYLEGAQDGIVAVDDGFVASLLDESVLVQRLVEDLQQLALADAGELRFAPELTDVREIAAQAVAAHAPRASQQGIELSLTAPGPAPVEGDPARLRQALDNLVGNALAYTPRGGRVEVTCVVDPDSPTVELRVTDTGVGIEADDLPHVFDRFFRVDRSRSRRTGGSGLGLAITRSLVEAHGGEVAVRSRPGAGSTFTVSLPRAATTANAP